MRGCELAVPVHNDRERLAAAHGVDLARVLRVTWIRGCYRTMTAVANARHATAVSRRRLIALRFRSGGACSGTDPIGTHEVGAPIRRQSWESQEARNSTSLGSRSRVPAGRHVCVRVADGAERLRDAVANGYGYGEYVVVGVVVVEGVGALTTAAPLAETAYHLPPKATWPSPFV